MLNFTQALEKYRADQARDERGRFVDEGKGRGRGGSDRTKPAPKATAADRRATTNARARERRRQQAFEARQRERAKAPKYRPVPRLTSNQGATAAANALRSAMTRLPQKHYDRLKNLKMYAVKDMAVFQNTRGGSIAGTVVAFFNPLVGVVVGEAFDGHKLADAESFAVHELAHAIDFFTGFDEGGLANTYGLSKAMSDVIQEEWRVLPESVKFYTEHYKSSAWNKELFAELYSAVYGPPNSRHEFMGAFTRDEVLKRFPRSVARLRSLSE